MTAEAADRESAEQQELDELSPTGEKFSDSKEPGGDEADDDEFGEQPARYSLAEDRAVLKKLDKRVVGLIAFLYLLSFLDRSSTSIVLISRRVANHGRFRYRKCQNCGIDDGLEAQRRPV
jgi:hypothetical protein